jgi:hypothetical protein
MKPNMAHSPFQQDLPLLNWILMTMVISTTWVLISMVVIPLGLVLVLNS